MGRQLRGHNSKPRLTREQAKEARILIWEYETEYGNRVSVRRIASRVGVRTEYVYKVLRELNLGRKWRVDQINDRAREAFGFATGKEAIMEWLGEGLSIKEMADRLRIHYGTARNYVEEILANSGYKPRGKA